MTQHELNQLVADATGESVSEIQHRGFGLADPLDVEFDPAPYDAPHDELVQYIDWDSVELRRNVALVEQPWLQCRAA